MHITKGCIIRQHARKHHNKMALQKGRTDTFQKQLWLFFCSTCITEVLDRCSCCHHLLVEQNAIKSVEICNSSIGFSPSYTFTFYPYALPKIFECVAYIHLHKNQRTKLDPCVVHCAFLSYATHKKGYRCYDPVTRCLYVSMNVTYLEHEFFFQKPISYSVLQGEILN